MDLLKGIGASLLFGVYIITVYIIGYGIGAVIGNAICEINYSSKC